jgi:serine/threonine-protein kinase HipA
MRKLAVYRNKEYAGTLTENRRTEYVFRYDDAYYTDSSKPAISLTLPKSQLEYNSSVLFPFFFNMLSEGVNRQLQNRLFKIDEQDNFGLLAATAQYDTIGAITVKPIGQK